MSSIGPGNLDELSLLELFRMEVETQSTILTAGLLDVERETNTAQRLAELMRAAHSVKGAARIVSRTPAVRVAHAMEECFVAAQKEKLSLSAKRVDSLLEGIDLLNRIAQAPEDGFETWETKQRKEIDRFLVSLGSLAEALDQRETPVAFEPESTQPPSDGVGQPGGQSEKPASDRALRVTAENLNRLMGLAGEARVASRWLDTFSTDLLRVQHVQRRLSRSIENLREHLSKISIGVPAEEKLNDIRGQITNCQALLTDRLTELEQFDRRSMNFSTRLYHEVLDCRMRPFKDSIQGFHRMVRDVARNLGKKVKLEIKGEATLVDRDILERLKAPLDHLLRNAIDHGIESVLERERCGKPQEERWYWRQATVRGCC